MQLFSASGRSLLLCQCDKCSKFDNSFKWPQILPMKVNRRTALFSKNATIFKRLKDILKQKLWEKKKFIAIFVCLKMTVLIPIIKCCTRGI